jgi:TRAP-type C4-dicarboxylate transport system substrate-binding protein
MSPRLRAPAWAAMVLALASGTEAAAQSSAPARLRLGTLAPQGTSYHHILQAMAERWRVATNGQAQLTVYAGTMGSELELVRRMRVGQLQAATITVAGLREIDRAVGALQLMPLMFRSLDELDFVRTRLAPVLARRMEERGFIILFWADAGWVRFFTRRPALHPAEFARFKTFVTAGDNTQSDLMRSAGFLPVSLEWSDALTALQTGMIDAVPTIPTMALAMQYYTVARNMLEVNWVPLVGAAIITRKAWDALSPANQEALRAAAAEAGRQFQERGRVESDEAVAAMRRRGLNLIPMTAAAEADWRALGESYYPQIRGTMVPSDMFDEVVRLLAEYRRSRAGAH